VSETTDSPNQIITIPSATEANVAQADSTTHERRINKTPKITQGNSQSAANSGGPSAMTISSVRRRNCMMGDYLLMGGRLF
jgi:hypothetical protein